MSPSNCLPLIILVRCFHICIANKEFSSYVVSMLLFFLPFYKICFNTNEKLMKLK